MSMRAPGAGAPANPLRLEFPQSLAVYDDYAAAQKAVDFLSDEKFPVEQLMIVGTELKRIERITGRLTTPRVAVGGLISGVWFGLFIGLVIMLFASEDDSALTIILSTVLFGALFGVIFALVSYAFTRGQRDFSSVTAVVATKYEVLVEHKSAAQARELLAKLPGGRPTRSPRARHRRPLTRSAERCATRSAPRRARGGAARSTPSYAASNAADTCFGLPPRSSGRRASH